MFRIILTTVSLFIVNFLGAQKQLVLYDKSSHQAIPFAAIVSNNYMTVSDEYGRFVLPDWVKHQVSIQHLSYQTSVFKGSLLKTRDTLYIASTIYQVKEVEVNYNLRDEYCQILSKALKHYRTKVIKPDTANYTYYLESKNDSMAVEKIKTVLELKSAKKTGLYLSQNYLKQGEFWYNPQTPYLNLSSEKFLLSFNALVGKLKDSPWFMPLNSKKAIKTNQYEVDIIRALGDTLTLGVATSDRNKQAVITFNKHDLSIYEVEFKIDSLRNHNLCDINTGEKAAVRNLQIKYFFNKAGDIKFIQYNMHVTNMLEQTAYVRGYFNRSAINIMPTINVFAGAYYPDNLYEQIILTGRSKLLDSIFNVNNYKGYILPDSVGLQSADSSFSHHILNLDIGTNNYSYWKSQRLNTDSYNIYEVDRYYYDPMVKQINKEENRVNVVWAFKYLNNKGELSLSNFPAMWYRNNQVLFPIFDTITVDLNVNLIFDLYELRRREVYDSVKTMNNVEQITHYIKKEYHDFNVKIDNLIVRLSKDEVDYDRLCMLNASVCKELCTDNLAMWFSLKSLDIENYDFLKQQYKHVRHAHLKYLKNSKDTLLLHAYTKSMIDITKIMLLLIQRVGIASNFEQAAYYHFLAEYYYSIGKFDLVCQFVEKYKTLSPLFYEKQNTKIEGVYIGSVAKSYFQEHCK
jgi:hypothetical protein